MTNPFTIAEELPYTLLSIPEYFRYMNVNPVHAQGGAGTEFFPLIGNACNDLIPQFSYQATGRVSREDIAFAIQEAEEDIARVLGYWPAPVWIAQETHPYPQHYRHDVWSLSPLDVTLRRVSIQSNFGKIIAPGQRDVTLVGTATVAAATLVYSDEDGDGFNETATITLPTTLTDVCELKVYHNDSDGAQEWEIRPARKKSISGGVVTFVFPIWLFIDPDVQAAYPTTDGFQGINLDTDANYVTSVQVYREFNDTTAVSSVWYWEPEPTLTNGFCSTCGGTGCVACQLTSQNGCLHIREVESGMVVPSTATYDSTTGQWDSNCLTVCRRPDIIKIYYYAGNLDQTNLRGDKCTALTNRFKRTIAHYATTKLEKPICSCQAVTALYRWLQTDLAQSGEESYQISQDDIDNPFSTRRGAVEAWKYIQNIAEHRLRGVVV